MDRHIRMKLPFLILLVGSLSCAPVLKGVVLYDPESQPENIMSICGLQMEGIYYSKVSEILEKEIGWEEPLNRDLVLDTQKKIILAFRKAGHPIVKVSVPPQNLGCGVLKFEIIEGLLGEVKSTGNRWFSNRIFKKGIHLVEGCPIDENQLLNDVALLNRSPFHRTDVVYSQGECEGYTNVELVNRDRFPLRVYAGGDNTGTRQIERERLFTGFDWGWAFGLDHVLSYQYCASPGFSKFQSHTFRYLAPLPWGHVLLLFGGFSTVRPHIPYFKNEGKSGQASLRYEIPMPSLFENWLQEVQIGFDGKSTNNNLTFSGSGDLAILKQTANLSQFVIGYDIGWEKARHLWSLNLLFFYSPGPMLANEKDADLQEFRAGAQNQYLYGKAYTTYAYTYPKIFSLWLMGRFQKSSRPLLPSEQLSIGGYDTVRGFDELLYNGDNGVIGNIEFRSPEISILRLCGVRKVRDRFTSHVFFDCGYADLITEVPDEPRQAYLSSAGAGIKYGIETWFSARLDWGFKIHNVPSLGDTSLGKLHVGVIVSY